MSLVFFAALVDPSGLPRPFLRFSGGPASGLFVQRLLLLTWVHCCVSSTVAAWAGARADWVKARVGARAGAGARTENRIGLSLYACFAIVVRLTRTRQCLAQD
jgi:hypothetical protein